MEKTSVIRDNDTTEDVNISEPDKSESKPIMSRPMAIFMIILFVMCFVVHFVVNGIRGNETVSDTSQTAAANDVNK